MQVFGTMVPDAGPSASPSTGDEPPIRERAAAHHLRYDDADRSPTSSRRPRAARATSSPPPGVDVTVAGPFHELRPGSSVHYGGSVRMHDDPEFGVLDGWNRVHDVPNVAVADSSSFTTGPEKNPTLTAMALAHRAASRLADDLSSDAP